MQDVNKIKKIIEALLIVSEYGLSDDEIKGAIGDVDKKDIKEGILKLKEEYSSPDRAFTIDEIAERYRIVTKPEYLRWINNLYEKEVDRLTGPTLETLSIIAYKQPVTRTEIEAIRGVNVGGIVKTLLDKGVIKVKGRKDVIGRPLLYATTDKFLEVFGLNSLNDLPALRDFSEEELDFGKPQEVVDMTEGDGAQEETLEEGQKQKKEETDETQQVKETIKIEVNLQQEEARETSSEDEPQETEKIIAEEDIKIEENDTKEGGSDDSGEDK